jgi:hypothetical protein
MFAKLEVSTVNPVLVAGVEGVVTGAITGIVYISEGFAKVEWASGRCRHWFPSAARSSFPLSAQFFMDNNDEL